MFGIFLFHGWVLGLLGCLTRLPVTGKVQRMFRLEHFGFLRAQITTSTLGYKHFFYGDYSFYFFLYSYLIHHDFLLSASIYLMLRPCAQSVPKSPYTQTSLQGETLFQLDPAPVLAQAVWAVVPTAWLSEEWPVLNNSRGSWSGLWADSLPDGMSGAGEGPGHTSFIVEPVSFALDPFPWEQSLHVAESPLLCGGDKGWQHKHCYYAQDYIGSASCPLWSQMRTQQKLVGLGWRRTLFKEATSIPKNFLSTCWVLNRIDIVKFY